MIHRCFFILFLLLYECFASGAMLDVPSNKSSGTRSGARTKSSSTTRTQASSHTSQSSVRTENRSISSQASPNHYTEQASSSSDSNSDDYVGTSLLDDPDYIKILPEDTLRIEQGKQLLKAYGYDFTRSDEVQKTFQEAQESLQAMDERSALYFSAIAGSMSTVLVEPTMGMTATGLVFTTIVLESLIRRDIYHTSIVAYSQQQKDEIQFLDWIVEHEKLQSAMRTTCQGLHDTSNADQLLKQQQIWTGTIVDSIKKYTALKKYGELIDVENHKAQQKLQRELAQVQACQLFKERLAVTLVAAKQEDLAIHIDNNVICEDERHKPKKKPGADFRYAQLSHPAYYGVSCFISAVEYLGGAQLTNNLKYKLDFAEAIFKMQRTLAQNNKNRLNNVFAGMSSEQIQVKMEQDYHAAAKRLNQLPKNMVEQLYADTVMITLEYDFTYNNKLLTFIDYGRKSRTFVIPDSPNRIAYEFLNDADGSKKYHQVEKSHQASERKYQKKCEKARQEALIKTQHVATSQDQQKPSKQGCGKQEDIPNQPKILISPTPEVVDREKQGCGKPDAPVRKNNTAHDATSTDSNIQEDLQGCGKTDEHQKAFTLKNDAKKQGDLSDVDVTFKESNKKHIFDNRPGHLPDTPENRKKIIELVKDTKNYLGPDENDNQWYGKILEDGTQLWGQTRGTIISNCGINDVPRPYNSTTGLNSFDVTKRTNK